MSDQPGRDRRQDRPLKRPQAVLLVHEASTGPGIFDGWPRWFPHASVVALDLQAGLLVEHATMDLYAGAVIAEAGRLPWPLLLCGLGAGGLVAMMSARTLRPELLVLLEPYSPAEMVASAPDQVLDPVQAARPHPRVRMRPDSALAARERAEGISVPAPLPCRSLVVCGDGWPETRGPAIAALYGSDQMSFAGLDHFELVLDERVPRAIARYAGFDVAGEAASS